MGTFKVESCMGPGHVDAMPRSKVSLELARVVGRLREGELWWTEWHVVVSGLESSVGWRE